MKNETIIIGGEIKESENKNLDKRDFAMDAVIANKVIKNSTIGRGCKIGNNAVIGNDTLFTKVATANKPSAPVAAGYLYYDTTLSCLVYYNGSAWRKITDAAV